MREVKITKTSTKDYVPDLGVKNASQKQTKFEIKNQDLFGNYSRNDIRKRIRIQLCNENT